MKKLSAQLAKSSFAGVLQTAIAKHLDITQSRVAQFVADGTFVKLPNGKLDKDDCRIRYIRWLRDETRKSSQSVAASRVQDARAAEIELRIQTKKGTLMAQAEATAIAVCDELFGPLKPDILAIPPRLTRDIALRQQFEDQIETAFNAAADRAKAGVLRIDEAGHLVPTLKNVVPSKERSKNAKASR